MIYAKRKKLFFLLIVLIILNGVLFKLWQPVQKKSPQKPAATYKDYPEVKDLEGQNPTFSYLKTYFTDLAEKKGAAYAFDVLRVASIPHNIDTHLLGHIVGEVLYRQKGADGISVCNQDFRNACSHSIVAGLFTEKGEDALSAVDAACQKAPGGKGAYEMCYHGLGHGVLAFKDYDEEKAIAICKKTTQSAQCIGGTIMELVSGGFHDRQLWEKNRKNYLSTSNPFTLCNSALIPLDAKKACFIYLTPFLWEANGANLAMLTEEDHKKALDLCEKVDAAYRAYCFGGFGSEFIGLAVNGDIRMLNQINDAQLKKVYSWCTLAPTKQGLSACFSQTLRSLYWGGENGTGAPIRFCKNIPDEKFQASCFTTLIWQVGYYIQDINYRKTFCEEIPTVFKEECQKELKNF